MDTLTIIIPLETYQKPDSECFKEDWLPFIERTLFEMTGDSKYDNPASELALELFEMDIDQSDVRKQINFTRRKRFNKEPCDAKIQTMEEFFKSRR